MDINTAIERMRELSRMVDAMDSDSDPAELQALALNMAVVWDGIDGWLSRGGFLPHAWHRASDAQS